MTLLTEEQILLRDAARNWVREKSPVSAFRKLRDSNAVFGYDTAVWDEMTALGWAGILVSEMDGGSGLGCRSMGLVLEELGRSLTASPLLASGMIAASALVLGGSAAQKKAWLPKIANGSVVATLAADEGARHRPEQVSTTVNGSKLNGSKVFVLEGMAAKLLIVSAKVDNEIELFLVPADAPGVTRERLSLIDSRGAANFTFENVSVGDGAKLEGGLSLLEKVLDRARASVAAEMLGSATHAFEMTIDYLKMRTQFGQVIGSFQALQHRAAEMYIDLELARSAVEAALTAIDRDMPNVPELVSIAKAKMGDTFHQVCNEMVQMHGGIGMTDEHDAGFYFKRARACEAMFGNQAYHRDKYANLHGY